MDLRILEIAAHTENNKVVENYTHKSKHKNPLCGDEMEVSIIVKSQKISDIGYQCKSCIYCQASASLLSKLSINQSLEKIKEINSFVGKFFKNTNLKFSREWKGLEKLFNKKNISRKECLLLPLRTIAKALKI